MFVSPESSRTAPDPRVDAYIAAAAPFAQPILAHIRKAMHAACPDVEEAIKWGQPHFMLDGRLFAGMSAFKAHCALGFWKGGGAVVAAVVEPSEKAMGQFGRLTSLADLPAAPVLRKLITEAAALSRRVATATAAEPPAPPRPKRAPAAVPDDLAAALRAQTAAQRSFDAFAPGQQREYIDWIVEAKRPQTRDKRIAQALEWIAEGKTRNWKYKNC